MVRRERSIKVTLTEEEFARFHFFAHEDGLPVATWLRQMALKRSRDMDDKRQLAAMRKFARDVLGIELE